MPLYLSQHTLACLTRQGAEALMRRMQAGDLAKAERVMVNMLEGKMFAEFRADSRAVLEAGSKHKVCTSIGWCVSNGSHERGNSFKSEAVGARCRTSRHKKKEMLHSPL